MFQCYKYVCMLFIPFESLLPSAVHSQALHEAASRSVPEARVLPFVLKSLLRVMCSPSSARHGSPEGHCCPQQFMWNFVKFCFLCLFVQIKFSPFKLCSHSYLKTANFRIKKSLSKSTVFWFESVEIVAIWRFLFGVQEVHVDFSV